MGQRHPRLGHIVLAHSRRLEPLLIPQQLIQVSVLLQFHVHLGFELGECWCCRRSLHAVGAGPRHKFDMPKIFLNEAGLALARRLEFGFASASILLL